MTVDKNRCFTLKETVFVCTPCSVVPLSTSSVNFNVLRGEKSSCFDMLQHLLKKISAFFDVWCFLVANMCGCVLCCARQRQDGRQHVSVTITSEPTTITT